MTIRYTMNRCLAMFLRGGKVNVKQYWWNIVSNLKVNKWSLSKWLGNQRPKNINVVLGQLFCRQCKAKFLLETDSLYWWSRRRSICYRYWQWIDWKTMSNTNEKAPVNWSFIRQLTYIYKNFKEQFSEACKVQVDCLKDSGSDSCDINDV